MYSVIDYFRMAFDETRHDMQERQHRWQTIESYCAFPIKTNPGMLQLENALYGDGGTHLISLCPH